MYIWGRKLARCPLSHPLVLISSTSAPFSIRYATVSSEPTSAALISAVKPSCGLCKGWVCQS